MQKKYIKGERFCKTAIKLMPYLEDESLRLLVAFLKLELMVREKNGQDKKLDV